MPNTRNKTAKTTKKVVVANVPPAKMDEPKETTYERLLNKVKERKRSLAEEVGELESQVNEGTARNTPKKGRTVKTSAKQAKRKGAQDSNGQETNITASAQFIDDENIVDMEVEGINNEFLSKEELEEGQIKAESSNNNATVSNKLRVQGRNLDNDVNTVCGRPRFADSEPRTNKLEQSVTMLQNFLLKKGLMSEGKLAELMGEDAEQLDGTTKQDKLGKGNDKNKKGKRKGETCETDLASEVTIYKRAVELEKGKDGGASKQQDKINQFIANVRNNTAIPVSGEQKLSSSSDEMMDTSDERENTQLSNYFAGEVITMAMPGRSDDPDFGMEPEPRKTPEDHAAEIIKSAERSKARMYEVPGRSSISVSKIDEDYQMVDAHVDEAMRCRIQSFEYVEFGKLLPKSKGLHEDDNRMEIITKNGFTYLSPVSEGDSANQINSYGKWEQAFRIYSNILTAKFPEKVTELFQYGHTIHSAATAYHWENVSVYDKEFRQHIGRHPKCSWSVILQQAWTMILKDRIRNNSNQLFQRGNLPGGCTNKKDKEPCRRFNKGKCTLGLSCKFDHRCSVPKCGKFGHGAHICRLRDQSSNAGANQPRENDTATDK